MFGSNNKREITKNGVISTSASHSLNSLVQGTTVEGSIRSESDIRVDGKIKGDLHCDAKVIIGPSGSVEGEIKCQNAVVEGHFSGKMVVEELLNVRETAKVNGDVITKKLIVQTGAVFNVTCQMGENKLKATTNNGAISSPKEAKKVAKVA